MNKVFLSGNLTRDPEIRYTQTGKAYARMGIAVRRQFSKDKDAVDFFNLVAWDKTAEFCGKYFTKGSRVLLEGRLQTSSYENKDGVKVNSTDIIIDNIVFADSKRSNSGGGDFSGTPANNGYPNRPAPPPRKSNDDWGGEPIDPEDTPF
ncbi:MAG: single-stranded DNA-binding protein [Selenomonadaceae bacterium]|nr:single-stranded DNA-binding protein [Selenomonadaceae bacterium]